MSIFRLIKQALVAMPLVVAAAAAHSGVVFVSGTDAMSLHGDASYIDPVLKTLQGTSTKNILVIGTTHINNTTTVGLTYGGNALSASDDLSLYSGVIFSSPCCSDPAARLGSRAADVAAYAAAGGSIYIEDYQGNAAWDPILGFTGGAGSVALGGSSPVCIDPGVSTTAGLAFGFEASYSEGCFVHQAYTGSFWASHGYFALQTMTDTSKWVTFASGFTEPGTVPEPTSLALVGLALAGAAASRRRAS